jgi:single-strand DNA-binding protein
MAGVNKVILIGNLGKDPEVRHLDNGRAVANFSLATSEVYNNKNGERVTNTEWHNIVMWTPLAELAEKYLKKGSQIYLEGKLQTRSYDDKDGNRKYITEVVAATMNFLGSRSDSNENSGSNSGGKQEPVNMGEDSSLSGMDTDDLPF